MPLPKETKVQVVNKFKQHDGDTGSPEVQVALLTARITQLVEHLKKNKKDQSSRRGLLVLVGQRKRLLHYLQRTDVKRFEGLTTDLGLQ